MPSAWSKNRDSWLSLARRGAAEPLLIERRPFCETKAQLKELFHFGRIYIEGTSSAASATNRDFLTRGGSGNPALNCNH